MVTLSGGHLSVDFASGAVPALLPFLSDEFDLSYTATAVLILAVLVSSSLLQPLFGLWSDRRGAMWLLPGGVALAGNRLGARRGGSVVRGSSSSLFFVAGVGIAAYHPEGAKFAAYASGRRRASGMSYFNIGGNSGYALAPILITPLVIWLGLEGGLLAMVPVVAFSLVLLRVLPSLRRLVPSATARRMAVGEDDPRAMFLLSSSSGCGASRGSRLLAFVPLWVVANGGTEGEGGRELALMLVSGAVGTLVLGPVADRIGLRRTLLVTQTALPGLIVVFVAVGGVVGTLALMLVGLSVVGTFGVTMVLGQLYLPRRVGMASGLTIGLAMGIGGIAAVVLGALADAIDLQTALYVCRGRAGARGGRVPLPAGADRPPPAGSRADAGGRGLTFPD